MIFLSQYHSIFLAQYCVQKFLECISPYGDKFLSDETMFTTAQLPLKMTNASKVVKRGYKIIILLRWFKSVKL